MSALIRAQDCAKWRQRLSRFDRVDVCQLPEYHIAYATRTAGAMPVMWNFDADGYVFSYPFLLTPVTIGRQTTIFQDISSIYGYSGPLSSTRNAGFLARAWAAFDEWCRDEKVIAEFVRFSPFARTVDFAHPDCIPETNREIAVSYLEGDESALLAALGKKTRNMIRKAEAAGLAARTLGTEAWLPVFRALYQETMVRNSSPEFFYYDDCYYDSLMLLPDGELQLFGVFMGEDLVYAAMALVHGQGALYHLGAGLQDFMSMGAGNLSLFAMTRSLQAQGVRFLNLGGGRTIVADDPLLRFKRSNATGEEKYFIGRRVVDDVGYNDVARMWRALYKTEIPKEKLIFYR